ncbi:MAG: D-inositol-3-phosphate glycosyltransferase [Thermoproteota archaeon]|nr:D-inositol-3-phosphate glycosyltransferase [Thermoproteota archaeon]
MKIAHLWYILPLYGGAERWALGLSKGLRGLGVDSEIVSWGSDSLKRYDNFIKVLENNIPSSPDIIDILMNSAFMAERLEEYDLVCSHHMSTIFPAVFSKSLHGSQVACILHSPPLTWELSGEGLSSYRQTSEKNRQIHTIWKMLAPYSDFFFTNSRWNRILFEKFENISPTPLLAGVDHDVFKPEKKLGVQLREKLGIDDETILLFYSAAAGHRKRHEILLRGLRTLVKKDYKVKCILTCSKDRRTRNFHPLVGRIVKELKLEDHVIAFPATSEKVLLSLYNACDIYVHPANNEHLGMSIMEAMAVGKPIVAQANGGVPEIVDENVEGLLFKTDSVNRMTEYIEQLIVDEKLRLKMGENAYERARKFDWTEVAQNFIQVVS